MENQCFISISFMLNRRVLTECHFNWDGWSQEGTKLNRKGNHEMYEI